VPGTIELMLTFIECGTNFTIDFGDVDARFYSSLSSSLREMADLLCRDGREHYPRFRDRIEKLRDYGGSIGWGYGDLLRDTVSDIESSYRDE
jgi:hypothetical protein